MTRALLAAALIASTLLSRGACAAPESDAAAYRRLAGETEANLRKHVIGMWFPRAVDKEGWGFFQDYGEQWNRTGDGKARSIVYQARLTWTAAEVSMRYPDLATEYRKYVRHGMEALRKLWDSEQGGFYWEVDAQTGEPTAARGSEKHAYGISFGIYAAATAYAATHDRRDLELARGAFTWMETHAHDAVNGGYYEALTREGKPILYPPGTAASDAIGTLYGRKSMNTHIHLLESYAALYRVSQDAQVRKRLDELFHIVRDKVYSERGYLTMFLTPDWKPIPGDDSFGHDIETAYLLTEASADLGRPNDARTWVVARSLVEHALKYGWDPLKGGFYDKGPPSAAATGRDKIWWTEAEGLNALLLMHQHYGGPAYFSALKKQWEYITNYQVDSRYGGWLATVHPDGTRVPGAPKSDAWTESYHQGRALMNVAGRLRQMAAPPHSN